MFFEEQSVVFEGYGEGEHINGKSIQKLWFLPFLKVGGIMSILVNELQFYKTARTMIDTIKMFFHRLINYWDKSNLEAQFLGWDRNESLNLFR